MADADQDFAPDLAAQASVDVDFRVEKKETRNYRISLLSRRARHWFGANFARGQDTRVIETDLCEANAFIHKARLYGYRTEYIGPLARFYF